MSSDLDRRGLGLLGGAHLSVDLCQAAVPALLPFFVDQRGYSYAAAGALVFAATVGSSLIQPLFGHAADRLQLPWLMPAGVIAAGAGIGLSGVTASSTRSRLPRSCCPASAWRPSTQRALATPTTPRASPRRAA